MIDEFGVSASGMPRTNTGFNPIMKYLCEKVFHISEICNDGCVRSVEGVENEHCPLSRGYWKISMDMLKPYEKDPEPIDVSEWESILSERG